MVQSGKGHDGRDHQMELRSEEGSTATGTPARHQERGDRYRVETYIKCTKPSRLTTCGLRLAATIRMLITVVKRLGCVSLGCHLSAGCCDHSGTDWMI